jgi:hypothetical protein
VRPEAPGIGRRKGGVPALSAYTQRDYEAIEAAVLESPRGRWFLNEFTRRNRAADTLMLLEAIRKLERGVAEQSPHHMSDELAGELHSLSVTIGATLVGEASEAEMGNAMEQLSRIKIRIDGLLADRSGRKESDGNSALTAENLKFFEGDEDLFEAASGPAPSPAPSLVVVGEEQESSRPVRTQTVQAETGAASLATGPKGDPKDRIVFIRRASSKETSIPLADEADDPLAAGQSQPGL